MLVVVPANTASWNNDVLLLGQRLRRWANIKTALFELVVFAGVVGRSRLLGNVLRLTNKGQVALSPCERGKHLSRPNRLPIRQVTIVLEHIEIFTGKSSHHSRNQNPNENTCQLWLYNLGVHYILHWNTEKATFSLLFRQRMRLEENRRK